MDRLLRVIAVLLVTAAVHSPPAWAATPSADIRQTPHNLSISGGGGDHDVKSTQEGRICIFCHTPHHATSQTPLWSRELAALNIYATYISPTLNASVEQPRGASKLCLSCHDGTIALGTLAGGVNLDTGLGLMPTDADPLRNPNLGTDLRDDHPISFAYPAAPELSDPVGWPEEVRLEEDVYLECTSCHDPHDNQYGRFLVLDSSLQQDALCIVCHEKSGWGNADSGHATGGTRYPAVAATVASQGCTSCHLSHNAPGNPYMFKAFQEEDNCYLSCHREPPYENIWGEFNASLYSHPVGLTQGVHQLDSVNGAEFVPIPAEKKHVECVDCHNPHQAGWQGAPHGDSSAMVSPATVAPDAGGPLRGVRGIDKTGTGLVDEVQYEYQVCFKCHSGLWADQFAGSGPFRPSRQYESFDQSSRFSAANPSYHPVVEDRQGDGRSLLPAFQLNMLRIYCIDCHHPHGSDQPYMLKAENKADYPAAGSSYLLCFSCHDYDYLLTPAASPVSSSVALHYDHVIDSKVACSVCHDPHGVPADQGAGVNGGAHLVNFDLNYVSGSPTFDAAGRSCSVSCHVSNPQNY
ncbi:MAG: cytochrome c3 family protein [Desulfuromonadales bacterium]|nr:cytochrome c3 family protein [Desulfuromonadales bacterium]